MHGGLSITKESSEMQGVLLKKTDFYRLESSFASIAVTVALR